jgi:hypothetical protein
MGIATMGYGVKTLANPSAAVTLQSGQSSILPSGQYAIQLGKYSVIQYYDPISLTWRSLEVATPGNPFVFYSDGYNYRLMNLSGTVVGGVITTLGTSNAAKIGIWPSGSSAVTGVTAIVAAPANAPTVTATMNVIVGGAVSQTVVVTAGGSGYVMPPVLTFSPPPAGGLLATGYAVVTAGAVSSVVMTYQGAGYTSAPTVTATSSVGDFGTGAVITAALVPSTGTTIGYGQTVAVTMASYGGGYATVPTVTVAGMTSTAITAVCCFTVVTAPTVSSATNRVANQLIYCAQRTAATQAGSMVNPNYTTNLFQMRNGLGVYNTSSSLATQTLLDGGMSQLDVSNLCVSSDSPAAASGTATYASGASGGAVSDVSWVIPL